MYNVFEYRYKQSAYLLFSILIVCLPSYMTVFECCFWLCCFKCCCFFLDHPNGGEGDEYDTTMESKSWWTFFAENIYCRQFFRAVSVVNLIVLVLSIPFYNLNDLRGNQEFIVTVQFQVITILDFILSCIYTFHVLIRCIKTVKAKVGICHREYEILLLFQWNCLHSYIDTWWWWHWRAVAKTWHCYS